MNVVGDVKNKICILIDDMVDSGNTIIKAATALKGEGAKAVYGCCHTWTFLLVMLLKI